MDNPQFVKFDETIAENINGETADGHQLELGNGALIYFKLSAIEQPVLNRLRSTESNLAAELELHKGYILLGELDALRAELHRQIDSLFQAITDYRKNQLLSKKEPTSP